MIGFRNLLVVCALCVPAVWPLTQAPFFSSDDGLFHLYRLAALDEALHQGNFYPRLFPSFAFGYGQAVLAYYGPLSYYLAELPRLMGASYTDALKWAFAAGYVLSALAAYALARRFVAPAAALLAAAVYVYFPYHLSETYQRGALAEHLAFVCLPVILWSLTPRDAGAAAAPPARRFAGSRESLWLCVSTAGLVLTHSLTAMLFLPFAAIYFVVMQRRLGRMIIRPYGWLRQAVQPALGLLAALGISAFYWLPILNESRWIGLSAGLDNTGYLTHLAALSDFIQPSLIFQYPPHQIVSADHPLGLLSLVLLSVMLVLTFAPWRRHDRLMRPLLLFSALALCALFMTLDLSAAIWTALHNPLTFLQYPWRFMTLAAIALAMGAALSCARFPRLALAAIAVVIVCGVAGLQPIPLNAAPADSAAMWQNDYAQRQIGATWTAEYVPWWVRADRTAIPAQARSQPSESSSAVMLVAFRSAGYDSWSLNLPGQANMPCAQSAAALESSSAATSLLRFHQFYLPQWRVALDGVPLQTMPTSDLGLLSVRLPMNQTGCAQTLDVQFALSGLETIGGVISLVTLLGIAMYWRGRWLLPAGLACAGVAIVLFLTRPAPPHALLGSEVGIQIGEFAGLLEAHSDRAAYRPGEALQVTLTWYTLSETGENLKGFVHLMNAAGTAVAAQSDGEPAGGFTPTSQWRSGELIAETRSLRIPEDAAAGPYRLYAGLYHADTVQNLPATRQGQAQSDGRVLLGEIQVAAR